MDQMPGWQQKRVGHVVAVMLVVLLSVVLALAQDSPKPAPQQPDQGSDQPQDRPSPGGDAGQQQQQRPTLGKGQNGEIAPRASTTTNPQKLLSIKSVYVDPIDNSLGLKLADGLARMGRFRIVAERKQADAVVTGTCFDSRRLKQVHSEVFLNERATGNSIWQDVVRLRYAPPPLNKAVDDTVATLLRHLVDSIREAERH